MRNGTKIMLRSFSCNCSTIELGVERDRGAGQRVDLVRDCGRALERRRDRGDPASGRQIEHPGARTEGRRVVNDEPGEPERPESVTTSDRNTNQNPRSTSPTIIRRAGGGIALGKCSGMCEKWSKTMSKLRPHPAQTKAQKGSSSKGESSNRAVKRGQSGVISRIFTPRTDDVTVASMIAERA